jgi:hypothetical protein
MNTYIKANHGFKVGQDFARNGDSNLACRLSDEYAEPRHTVAYIKAQPDSPLGFMRRGDENGEIRIHAKLDCVLHVNNESISGGES